MESKKLPVSINGLLPTLVMTTNEMDVAMSWTKLVINGAYNPKF